jgi:hypothetical protein
LTTISLDLTLRIGGNVRGYGITYNQASRNLCRFTEKRGVDLKKRFEGNVVMTIAIVLIVLVSQFRLIDGYVENYTDESIKRGAIVFATARGINALVSMAQSTTVEVGFIVSGSVSIGEILDPLNDLIERFSFIMTLVLSALVAIKILLSISAHDFFNYLIVVMGVFSIAVIYFNRRKEAEAVLKFFTIVVFIRFSLGIMVALNSVVDHAFLIGEVDTHEQNIEVFKDELELDSLDNVEIDFLKGLERKVESGVSSFLNLMVIFVLKSILLPLSFFFLLFSGVKLLWRSNILKIG